VRGAGDGSALPVAKYDAYVGTQAAWFTTPIWNVFLLANGFSYTQLGFLNSAWWAATVLGVAAVAIWTRSPSNAPAPEAVSTD
jgi:hypothetical protein